MSPQQLCSRCGTRMVAGFCPACGSSVIPASVQRPSVSPLRKVRIITTAVGLGNLLLILLVAVHHRVPAQSAPRNVAAQARWPVHQGPVAQLAELHGHGTIYLVQLTPHTAAYSANDLATWLRTRYGLDARTLPPEPLPKPTWHGWRRQHMAETIYAEIRRAHPALATDQNAYLIGLTDADMYSVGERWSSTFTERYGQAAIISSALLEDGQGWWGRAADQKAEQANVQARTRRVLLKDVALLYWHLPVNNDPSSLLHQPEDPDLPTEDIYESDLDPAASRWGQLEGEPCLYFWYSAKTGLQITPWRLIGSCSIPTPQQNESTELFEVDLRLGTMVDRRTDVWIPGEVPIAFERALRPGWKGGSNPFGASGTDSYDGFLASADNIFISVVGDDGGRFQLVRDPIWLSWLSLTKYVDTEYSGQLYEMRWRTSPYPHYDLRRFDGEIAAYLPCDTPTPTYCYLNGVTEAGGQQLKFDRGFDRRLLQLTSSTSGWLKVDYETGPQIEGLADSRGHTVRYGYNAQNQLTSVKYSSGETLLFEYDDANELTAFSAAPDDKTKPKVLLRCEYQNGLLTRQVLADGSAYLYKYGPMDDHQARTATVDAPDGEVYTIRRYGDSSLIWKTKASAEKAAIGGVNTPAP